MILAFYSTEPEDSKEKRLNSAPWLSIPILVKLSAENKDRSLQKNNFIFSEIHSCSSFKQRAFNGYLEMGRDCIFVKRIRNAGKIECLVPGLPDFQTSFFTDQNSTTVATVELRTNQNRRCILSNNL